MQRGASGRALICRQSLAYAQNMERVSSHAYGGSFCRFLEQAQKTSHPRTLKFAGPIKTREIYGHRQVAGGRGSIWLSLIPDQYRKLKRR
jgi:hypothetical protein